MWRSGYFIKRQVSYILEISTTHATEYNKKGFEKQNINTNNTSSVGQIVKKLIQTFCSCILVTWLCKEHHPMHVMDKVIGNNITS